MADTAAAARLSDEQAAVLQAERDRLERQIARARARLSEVDDLLMADLKARTGFPRERAGSPGTLRREAGQ